MLETLHISFGKNKAIETVQDRREYESRSCLAEAVGRKTRKEFPIFIFDSLPFEMKGSFRRQTWAKGASPSSRKDWSMDKYYYWGLFLFPVIYLYMDGCFK